MLKPSTEINEEELKVITGAIWNRYGIDFRNYEQISLRRRIKRVIDKFELNSVYALWKKFLYQQDFINIFIDEITIGLTELFRNPDLWTFLGKEILQKYSSNQKVNIWHAGCSSGEEVYSMLITLKEYQLMDRAEVWATDISPEALRKAKLGKYDQHLWNKYNSNYKAFTNESRDLTYYANQVSKAFQMKPILRDSIHFGTQNLARDGYIKPCELIFCRNVLIYFDTKLKIKVLEKFREALSPGGLLILGYYDYISYPQDYFKLKYPEYKIFIAK